MGEPLVLPPPAAPAYRDRSTGLVILGLLQLLLCLVCLGFSALMAAFFLSPAMREAQQLASRGNPKMLLVTLLVYPLGAAFFGTMGVGTLLGRRWARAIWLVLSWIWMAVGIFSTAALASFLPKVLRLSLERAAPAGGAAEATTCAVAAMIAVATLVYFVMPLGFLLFFRSPHVKATVEAKDPKVRWTDRVPLPVLGAVLVSGYVALTCLFAMGYGVFPVAGTLVRGVPAALIFLFLAVASGLLTVGLYRLRPAAWTGMVALYGAFTLLTLLNLARGIPWREIYTEMGTPPEEIDVMEKSGILAALQGPGLMIPTVLLMLAALGYLLWLKKFFRKP